MTVDSAARTDVGLWASQRATCVRLFLTVWLVFSVHFTTNVVRETYLAVTVGESLSLQVDEYLGLHPDLFEIPGRGAYINNNPGASFLGAVPYALARPGLELLYRLRPGLISPKPPATYDDPRPNRTAFMNEARARGVDIKLGMAALVTQVGLMGPLGGAAAVVMFLFLCARLGRPRLALWLALLYAFATPVFFRSAFLNQNLIIAHLVLAAYVLAVGLTRPSDSPAPSPRRQVQVGLLLGATLLCDYSGAPLTVAFGLWLMWLALREGGGGEAFRAGVRYSVGVLAMLAVLLAYQWAAFGNPILPAQTYMPATEFSVRGWFGFTVPTLELLAGNWLDPRYGLLAFSPLLLAALAAPWVGRSGAGKPGPRWAPTREQLALVFGATAALWMFSSANQFANLQWNTGVRYMVPAVPLLFVALVPVLVRAPALVRWGLVLPSVIISWSVSMAREDVPRSLLQIFTTGLELPVLTVLQKMASGYLPTLEAGVSPIPVFAVVGVVVWLIWRGRWAPLGSGGDGGMDRDLPAPDRPVQS